MTSQKIVTGAISTVSKLVHSGYFYESNQMRKRIAAYLLGRKAVGLYFYSGVFPISELSLENQLPKSLQPKDLAGEKVLILCERKVSGRVIAALSRYATAVDCFYDRTIMSKKALKKVENLTLCSLQEKYPQYDVSINQEACRKSVIDTGNFSEVFSQLAHRSPMLSLLRGHEHAFAQTVEPSFFGLHMLVESLRPLCLNGSYDRIILMFADSSICRCLLGSLMTHPDVPPLAIARTKRNRKIDHKFFDSLARIFKRHGKKLGFYARLCQTPSKSANEDKTTQDVSPRSKISRTIFNFRESIFARKLALRVNDHLMPKSSILLFPTPSGMGPGSLGDLDLLESLAQTAPVALLTVPGSAEDEKVSLLEKKLETIKQLTQFPITFHRLEIAEHFMQSLPDQKNAVNDLFRVFLRLAIRRSATKQSQSSTGQHGIDIDYRELEFTSALDEMAGSLSALVEKLVAFTKFLDASAPRTVLLYPSSLPTSRVLATEAEKRGSLVCDIQPFFVMDEPRTAFHWHRTGQKAFVQSEDFVPIYQGFGYKPENIHITGTPRMEHLRKRPSRKRDLVDKFALDISLEDKVILFAGQMMQFSVQSKILSALTSIHINSEKVKVIFKMHYMMNQDAHDSYKEYYKDSENLIIEREMDIYSLIQTSDVVVTLFSNVALEAAILKKPCICVSIDGKPYPEPMDLPSWGIAESAANTEELKQKATELMTSKFKQKSLLTRQQDYFDQNPYGILESAPKKISSTLQTILKKQQIPTERFDVDLYQEPKIIGMK